jgi:hypothetical protein
VATWADGGEPCARGDVKDAHSRCNAGCARQEEHEVRRDVGEGAIVLCRRSSSKLSSSSIPAFTLFSHSTARSPHVPGRKVRRPPFCDIAEVVQKLDFCYAVVAGPR